MNSSTGEVGGEGVGGLLDDEDLTHFCGGCHVSLAAVDEVVAVVEEVALEEITGAKMRVARGGSRSLLSAKWMKSALSSPLRLFKTGKVMSFVRLSWRAVA